MMRAYLILRYVSRFIQPSLPWQEPLREPPQQQEPQQQERPQSLHLKNDENDGSSSCHRP